MATLKMKTTTRTTEQHPFDTTYSDRNNEKNTKSFFEHLEMNSHCYDYAANNFDSESHFRLLLVMTLESQTLLQLITPGESHHHDLDAVDVLDVIDGFNDLESQTLQ